MTWFKVDDAFWAHPKVLTLSDAALALWVRSGSYCAQQLTNGHVRAEALPMLRSDEYVASDLVSAGLWHETPTGYVFHDWAKYQPTRESVEEEREAWRARQRESRAKRGENVTRDKGRDSRVSQAVPSRPVPSPDSSNDESHKALDLATESTFEQAWANWPRKQSKKAAQAKFVIASKRHPRGMTGLAADIVDHGRAYIEHGHPVEFVPMLSTWLNGDRWTDPKPTARNAGSTPQRDVNAAILSRYASEGDHE